MSHFSVLVINPTELTTETLGAILQPWHEFECTGKDDQYVQNVDITEEALSSYHSDVSDMLRSPEGELVARVWQSNGPLDGARLAALHN